MGGSLVKLVHDFFRDGVLPPTANDRLIVLLAKVDIPEFISQFRPIRLSNVYYKTITKILVNRLKPIMSKLESPMQSSFILGRMISDNIVLVQEAVHSMGRKRGRKGWMILKLDLEKAYDRLR